MYGPRYHLWQKIVWLEMQNFLVIFYGLGLTGLKYDPVTVRKHSMCLFCPAFIRRMEVLRS